MGGYLVNDVAMIRMFSKELFCTKGPRALMLLRRDRTLIIIGDTLSVHFMLNDCL